MHTLTNRKNSMSAIAPLTHSNYPSVASVRNALAFIVLAAICSACTSNGPEYVALIETGDRGYSSQMLDNTKYRISFARSSGTPVNIVQDLALLRAAEIALENNFDQFTIAEETVTPMYAPESEPSVIVTTQSYRSCRPLGCTAMPWVPPADGHFPDQLQQFTSTLTVVM